MGMWFVIGELESMVVSLKYGISSISERPVTSHFISITFAASRSCLHFAFPGPVKCTQPLSEKTRGKRARARLPYRSVCSR